MLRSRDNIEARRDAKVDPLRKSFGPLQASWRIYNDEAVNLNEAAFSIDLKPLDCAVAD
jgi:hypothetical protein